MPSLFAVLGLVIVWAGVRLWDRGKRKQAELPSRGFGPTVFSSYLASLANFRDTKRSLHAFSNQYGDRRFTFPLLGEWFVMCKSREHAREHSNIAEEVLSMEAAVEKLLQSRYTVGEQFCSETYHIPAIKTSLNINLASKLPEMLDEIARAYDEDVDTCIGDDWTPLWAPGVCTSLIARVSNRVFVGEKLCRNRHYRKLVEGFSDTIIRGGVLHACMPRFFRPFAGRLFRFIFGHHRRMVRLLSAEIVERQNNRATGKVQRNPNDMLEWLIEQPCDGPAHPEHTVESLAMRMLNVNFVALHTTTKTFIHVLYDLAARPEYLPILRDEAQSLLDPSNLASWTKESLARCIKLDSFVKESLRLNGPGPIWMPRLPTAEFRFSDGTVVWPGNLVAIAITAIHEDEVNYAHAKEFDGLRFVKMAGICAQEPDSDVGPLQADPELKWEHRLTGTSPTFLAFGSGRHICPGRFFASLELKSLLAGLILRYDVRMADEGVRPPDRLLGPVSTPAQAKVLFRKRQPKDC
ncbi:Cytochrome P450 [Mycena chlorophos]|uniref:Cytochrome P450 n=1 Tax=Mycena chlorophos TaxID=658473 RepID=A0A8H6SKC8_MYCCL|nr:Cytochrome P450 [Mycena chlorophos]